MAWTPHRRIRVSRSSGVTVTMLQESKLRTKARDHKYMHMHILLTRMTLLLYTIGTVGGYPKESK